MKSFNARKPVLVLALLLSLMFYQINQMNRENSVVWDTRDKSIGQAGELLHDSHLLRFDGKIHYYKAADQLARNLVDIDAKELDPQILRLIFELIERAEAAPTKSFLNENLLALDRLLDARLETALTDGKVEEAKKLFLHRAKYNLFEFQVQQKMSFFNRCFLFTSLCEKFEEAPQLQTPELKKIFIEFRALLHPTLLYCHDVARDEGLKLLEINDDFEIFKAMNRGIIGERPSKQSRWLYSTGIGFLQLNEKVKFIQKKAAERQALESGQAELAGSWASDLKHYQKLDQYLSRLIDSYAP